MGKAAGSADSENGEASTVSQHQHNGKAQQSAGQAVHQDGWTATEHCSKCDADQDDQQGILPTGECVEGQQGNQVCEPQFGSRCQKRQRKHSFEEEQRQ